MARQEPLQALLLRQGLRCCVELRVRGLGFREGLHRFWWAPSLTAVTSGLRVWGLEFTGGLGDSCPCAVMLQLCVDQGMVGCVCSHVLFTGLSCGLSLMSARQV